MSVQIQTSQISSLSLQFYFSKNILADFRSSWPSIYTLFLWFEDARDCSLHCRVTGFIEKKNRNYLLGLNFSSVRRMLTWHKEGLIRVASLAHYKPSVIAHVCNPSTQEMEAREADSQNHLQLHSEFEGTWDSARKPRKKFIFPFTSHCLDVQQRLNETFLFCFVLSMMCNFTFTHWLSLSVVVFWTTLKSLVWEVLGSECLHVSASVLTPSCVPSSPWGILKHVELCMLTFHESSFLSIGWVVAVELLN